MLKESFPTVRPRPRRRRTSSWQDYESEKRKLMVLELTPDEYDRRIAEITKRLGV
jgi:hypothetical protein